MPLILCLKIMDKVGNSEIIKIELGKNLSIEKK